MSRGAQQTTRNLTDQQLAQQNQMISQEGQSDTQDRSLLMPTIQSLLNSQGYTPQQQSAITQQSLEAWNTAFNALQAKAANRTAATNNSADYGDLTAQLGREQAQTDAGLGGMLGLGSSVTSLFGSSLPGLANESGDHGQVIGFRQPVQSGVSEVAVPHCRLTVTVAVLRPNSFVAFNV
jgi:hypothetical protein